MSLENLAKVVSKVAPILGAALSSTVVGAPVGMIISGLGALFGATNDPADIIEKINNDPDSNLKLRQYELQHEETLYTTVTNDRINARERESNIVKSTGKRDLVLDVIALFMIFGFFAIMLLLTFTKIDPTVHDVLYLLVGQLSGSFVLVMSYYFGSSVPVKQGLVVLPPPGQTR